MSAPSTWNRARVRASAQSAHVLVISATRGHDRQRAEGEKTRKVERLDLGDVAVRAASPDVVPARGYGAPWRHDLVAPLGIGLEGGTLHAHDRALICHRGEEPQRGQP